MEDSYVLITPVKNEEKFIKDIIEIVIQQTILPTRWVIIDDVSTDSTPEIINEYSKKYDFITPLKLSDEHTRNYGSRVKANILGYEKLAETHSKFLGFLDADISFSFDYYESIFRKFEMDDRLGVAGGVVFDEYNGKLDSIRLKALEHVAGGVQMFRRDCYDAIGGYIPLQFGGDDFVAETMARKLGWRTQSFPEIKVIHRRITGTEEVKTKLLLKVREGFMDYSIGYSKCYHTLKCISKLMEKPIIISSIARLFGYCWASLKLRKPFVPTDFVEYVRKEQIAKIKEKFNLISP
jgi:glycosyltransferase involved in cell wall biosynthesis